MTSLAGVVADLDPRIRGVMAVEVLATFGIVLAFATGRVAFAVAMLAFVGLFVVTGLAYAYLLLFG